MTKKHFLSAAGAMLGVAGAASEHHWPEDLVPIQLGMYSAAILLIIGTSFWADRHHPRYWPAMVVALLIHAIVLFQIRPYFPFKTVLAIVPLWFMEAAVVMFAVIKIRGEKLPESPTPKHPGTSYLQGKPAGRHSR